MKQLFILLLMATTSFAASEEMQNLPGQPIDSKPLTSKPSMLYVRTVIRPVFMPEEAPKPKEAAKPASVIKDLLMRRMDTLTPGSTPHNLTPLRKDQIRKD
jgi:hypothetical protein